MLDEMDRETWAVGYAYPGSRVAADFGKTSTGTWYADCDGREVQSFDTATDAAAFVQERVDAGHLRSQFCQTLTCVWSIIKSNEAAISAATRV